MRTLINFPILFITLLTFLNLFLISRHKLGFCMLDKPDHDMIETSSQLLAGEKFPANQQCELVFGPNSKVCPFTVTVSMLGQQIDQVGGGTRQ